MAIVTFKNYEGAVIGEADVPGGDRIETMPNVVLWKMRLFYWRAEGGYQETGGTFYVLPEDDLKLGHPSGSISSPGAAKPARRS